MLVAPLTISARAVATVTTVAAIGPALAVLRSRGSTWSDQHFPSPNLDRRSLLIICQSINNHR